MKGFVCIIDFQGNISFSITNGSVLHSDKKTFLWVNRDYGGKYIWTTKSANKFLLLTGTAFFKESVNKKQQLINSEAHLTIIQEQLGNGLSPQEILTGFYNLIYVDSIEDNAIIHNSHFGMRPLFYARKNNQLIISNNPLLIIKAGIIEEKINYGSVLQFLLFNYTINEGTVYKYIYTLPSGSRINLFSNKLRITRYFDAVEMIRKPEFNHKESIELIYEAFDRVIEKYTNNISSFSLSLTGGWDGRLILSMLKDKNVRVTTYSHGSIDNPDIIIPGIISKQLSIPYTPYLLNEDYYSNRYIDLARETLINSSCTRAVSRSHYLYSVGSELTKNKYVLTGICGSNLLKGNILPGPVSNAFIIKFIMEPDFNKFWNEIIFSYENKVKPFLEVSEKEFDELYQDLSVQHGEYHAIDAYEIRLYRFILNHVERKYFGSEIMTYSHLGENLSPFIDIDFVSALSKSTFFGAYIPSNRINIFANWRNSLLYAEMINRSYPALGKIVSDKGVNLSDLLKFYKWPKVAAIQVKKRYMKNKVEFYDHSSGLKEILISIMRGKLLSQDKIKILRDNPSETNTNIISYFYWIQNLMQ